jgi:hypothetical protein
MPLETVIVAGLIALAWYVSKLVQRVKRLEQETGKIAQNASIETVDAIGQVKESFLHPFRNAEAPDPTTPSAVEISEGHSYRLSEQIPGLRRVLKFSIGVSLDYLREKTGVTVGQLKGLEEQFETKESKPVWIWPASSMVMEEWATHTVVTDLSGRRNVIYPDNKGSSDHRVIWSHSLSGAQHFGSVGSLQVVLFEESIVVWAIDGRFQRGLVDLAAKTEYRLAAVPLNENILRGFCSPSETPPENPKVRSSEVPWIRYYECGGPDEDFAWRLTVTDIVGFVAETHRNL